MRQRFAFVHSHFGFHFQHQFDLCYKGTSYGKNWDAFTSYTLKTSSDLTSKSLVHGNIVLILIIVLGLGLIFR